ncbi:hypothetical protein HBR93_20705, partial [Pseudomonas sp. WS 5411]|uniref:ESPR-type extended signal peptide-containing protein n=1 Tax=Pseudomonas sp. WS 5411 TaxID=2717486 RepID=UPI001698C366
MTLISEFGFNQIKVMNKIYSVVWNSSMGCWMVVSELVAAKGKSARSRCFSGVGNSSGDSAWKTSLGYGILLKASATALVLALPLTGHASTISTNGGAACVPGTFSGADGTTRTQTGADGNGYYSTVAGCAADGQAKFAVTLFGAASQALGDYASAFGVLSQAATRATAVGTQATASASDSIAIGILSKVLSSATGGIAVGSGANVASSATAGIAVGSGAQANGPFGIAQGYRVISGATGQNVAIGSSGTTANAGGSSSGAVAIGINARALGDGAVSMGGGNIAAGDPTFTTASSGAVAIGYGNTAYGKGSLALGNLSNAAAAGAVALGDTAVAKNTNDVALGSKSTTAAPHTGTTAQFGGTAAGVQAAASTNGVVSVGAAGTERQVQNVAAGVISATSTDAINGSQLNSVLTGVNNLGTTTASTLGGGAIYSSATGNITGFSQPINSISTAGAVTGPTAQTTVAAALTALNTNVDNTANIAVKYDASGGTKITLGATGGAGAGAPVTITNLAAATLNATSTDAVNGSQLFATNTTVNSINNGAGIKYFHTNSILADSSATGTNSVAVGPTASSTATNAVALGNGATAGTANSVALGSGATTAAATATTSVVINGTTYTYAGIAPVGVLSLGSLGSERQLSNVAAGQVTATSTDAVNGSQLFSTNTAVNSLGTTLNNISNGAGIKYFHSNSTLADSTATGTNSVAVGPTASSTATNAVALGNGATAASANSVALGSGSSATGTTLGTAAYGVGGTATTGGEVNVANGTNGRRITGLAAGANATDAVNVNQLNKTGQDTAAALGGGAAVNATTGAWTAPSYTVQGSQYNNVGGAIGAVDGNLTTLNNSISNGSVGVVQRTSTPDETVLTAAGGDAAAPGAAQKLSNLAAGTLSATSTDAVNGSQLFGTNTQVSNLGTATASNLGGGATYDPVTGTVSAPSYTVQGSQYNNVGGAIGAVDGNLTTLNNSISNGSVGVVQRTSTPDETVLTAAGGDAAAPGAAQKLSNLAAGTLSATSTDAVNGSQLFGTNTQVSNLGTATASNLGGGAAYDPVTGTVSAPSYTVQG